MDSLDGDERVALEQALADQDRSHSFIAQALTANGLPDAGGVSKSAVGDHRKGRCSCGAS